MEWDAFGGSRIKGLFMGATGTGSVAALNVKRRISQTG